MKYFIVIGCSLLFMGCNFSIHSKTDEGENKIDNILYNFYEIESKNINNCDSSFVGEDCGYGNIYFTKKGASIYVEYCMGNQVKYYLGTYTKTNTSISCHYTQELKEGDENLCDSCSVDYINDPLVDKKMTDGYINNTLKTTDVKFTLKKVNCNIFNYYLQGSDRSMDSSQFKTVVKKETKEKQAQLISELTKYKALKSFFENN